MSTQAIVHDVPVPVARRDPWPAILMLGSLALWLFVVATYIIALPDSAASADPPTRMELAAPE